MSTSCSKRGGSAPFQTTDDNASNLNMLDGGKKRKAVAKKPAAKKPVAKKPAAKKPVAKKPAAKKVVKKSK